MSTGGGPTEAEIVRRGQENLATWDLTSGDGTVVRVWSNQARVRSGPDALTVVVAAGLGTMPESWPTLIAQPERYRVFGAYYRGTHGAPRPGGGAPTVEDHVGDLVSLMDSEGIDTALWAGWSMGVNIACEAALRHPDRVSAVLGVAGVPGDTFSAILGPLPVPRRLRRPIGTIGALAASRAGPLLNAVIHRLSPEQAAWLVRKGIALPQASPDYLVAILRDLMTNDFGWYFTLATGHGRHGRLDLAAITQPVTLIAGRWDILTAATHIQECAALIPDCRFERLAGSHFVVAEYAPEIERALDELAVRTGLLPISA